MPLQAVVPDQAVPVELQVCGILPLHLSELGTQMSPGATVGFGVTTGGVVGAGVPPPGGAVG